MEVPRWTKVHNNIKKLTFLTKIRFCHIDLFRAYYFFYDFLVFISASIFQAFTCECLRKTENHVLFPRMFGNCYDKNLKRDLTFFLCIFILLYTNKIEIIAAELPRFKNANVSLLLYQQPVFFCNSLIICIYFS